MAEDFAELQEVASMMESLMMRQGGEVTQSSSPMTQFQPGSRGGTPQVFDASNAYDSDLLHAFFLRVYRKQQDQSIVNIVSIAETLFPAIEHGIVPSCLEKLKQVCISDVIQKVNHIHTDCVMLVEVIHLPFRQVGTMVLVKDSAQNIMILALYNYVDPQENPKELFPVGKKLALVCPLLNNDSKHLLMLRCDNPQFVVSYDDENFVWKKRAVLENENPSELRQLGNLHFQNGDMKQARLCYSKALAHSDIDNQAFISDKVSCLSNRAEVNLRLQRWKEAANDAQDVLAIQSDHVKAKFRLAKALSRMGKASDALVLVKQLQKGGGVLGRSKEMKAFINECRKIAKEERGEYDIPSMMKEASTQKAAERISFHATFCSPNIAVGVPIMIRSSGKSYRGCKALSNLKEGTLIMSSKALAMARKHSEGGAMDPFSHGLTLGEVGRMELISEVVLKLWKTPSLGTELYSLTDGDPSHPPVHDVNKIDLTRIRDIIRSNSFGHNPYDEGLRQTWEKLKAGFVGDPRDAIERQVAAGLWMNVSMLNNSCTPNCTWTTIADQIFVHTTRPIKEGDELCISYFPTNGGYEDRLHAFRSWTKPGVGFECVCDHCDFLRSRDDLRQLAEDINDGMSKVDELENSEEKRMTTAIAGQSVFPASRRRAIFTAFSHLPLRLQHSRISELHQLESTMYATKGDLAGALKSNQLAANVNYAVRGSDNWNFFMETWCIAGLAMACNQHDLARSSLEKIWKFKAFGAYPKDEAEAIFRDLTKLYVTQQIPFDPRYEFQIHKLIRSVLKGTR